MAELEALPILMSMMQQPAAGGAPAAENAPAPSGGMPMSLNDGKWPLRIGLGIVAVIVVLGIVLAIIFLSGKCSGDCEKGIGNIMNSKSLDSGDCGGS
jgi:hypothetical protein